MGTRVRFRLGRVGRIGVLLVVATATSFGVRAVSRKSASAAVDPLAVWHGALANSGQAPANVVLVGDSITEGYDAPDQAHRWVDLSRSSLQAKYGGSGIGYIPVVHNEVAAPPFAELWTHQGGTPTYTTGLGLRSYELNSSSAFAQATVTTDRIQLFYTATPTSGAMQIQIDGTQAATVDTYNASGVVAGRTWTSNTLTSGSHTVRVQPSLSGNLSVDNVILEGMMVDNGNDTSGVRVWEGGHGGYTSASFLANKGWANDIGTINPDLVVIELGANDEAGGMSPAQFESNLGAMIDLINQHTTKQPSILLLPVWNVIGRNLTTWQQYVQAQQDLANTRGLAIDNTVAGIGTVPAALTADGAHPNVAGSAFMAQTVLGVVQPGYVAPAVDSLSMTGGAAAGGNTITLIGTNLSATTAVNFGSHAATNVAVNANGTVLTLTVPGGSGTVAVTAISPTATTTALNAYSYGTPQAPGLPQAITASPTSSLGVALLSWAAPASVGSAAVDGYLVQAFDETTSTVRYVGQQSTQCGPCPWMTFTGLTAGHTYAFAVYAHNLVGYSGPGSSNALTLPVPPGAPTSVTASSNGGGVATVTWVTPASNGGAAVDSYMVQTLDMTTSTFVSQEYTPCGQCTTFNQNGLIPGHNYVFAVYAHNIVGYSAHSFSNQVQLS